MKKDPAKVFEDDGLILMISNYADTKAYSDRDAVIVLSSIIEELLERILKKTLCVYNNDFQNQLFNTNGPLCTFSCKNAMAFAIGKISKDVYDDIEVLRKCRNEFAHNIIHEEIGSRSFSESILPRLKILNGTDQKDIVAAEEGATNRYRLILEVFYLCLILASTLRGAVSFESPDEHDKYILNSTNFMAKRLFEKNRSSEEASTDSGSTSLQKTRES